MAELQNPFELILQQLAEINERIIQLEARLPEHQIEQKFLSIGDVIKRTNWSASKIRRLINQDENPLPTKRTSQNGHYTILSHEFESWLESLDK